MKTQSKILYLMFFYTMFFSCKNSNDMVEFKSVIFENRKFVEEDITEPGFYNNLKIVLDYYGVDYEFKNDVIYVQNKIYEEKEIMMNYTSKARNKEWIKQNSN